VAPVDYKKKDKAWYQPGVIPTGIFVPELTFLMIDGQGDPNGNPEFAQGVEMLYALSYGVRMSKGKPEAPSGFFEYVVPPLEGLWWVEDNHFDLKARDNWLWTLMIRQPEFLNKTAFEAIRMQVSKKKPQLPLQGVRLESWEEGFCVQALHMGPFATETVTMAAIQKVCQEQGWTDLVGFGGRHHEIYLSDPRKVSEDKQRTILRHPVKKGKVQEV
jgi:hypothetical protein